MAAQVLVAATGDVAAVLPPLREPLEEDCADAAESLAGLPGQRPMVMRRLTALIAREDRADLAILGGYSVYRDEALTDRLRHLLDG